MGKVVILQPRGRPDPGTVWADGPRAVEVEEEGAEGWRARPVDNPACPPLFFPRYAWEEMSRPLKG